MKSIRCFVLSLLGIPKVAASQSAGSLREELSIHGDEEVFERKSILGSGVRSHGRRVEQVSTMRKGMDVDLGCASDGSFQFTAGSGMGPVVDFRNSAESVLPLDPFGGIASGEFIHLVAAAAAHDDRCWRGRYDQLLGHPCEDEVKLSIVECSRVSHRAAED